MDALATAYTAMDGAYQMLGQPENAVHDRLALEIYEQLGRTRTVATIESNLGVQAYSEGRWDEAIAWYRRAQEHSLESEAPRLGGGRSQPRGGPSSAAEHMTKRRQSSPTLDASSAPRKNPVRAPCRDAADTHHDRKGGAKARGGSAFKDL